MKISATMSLDAVLEKLGPQNATDYEATVMRDVLVRNFDGQELESLSEAEWLRAYGEMNAEKTTGSHTTTHSGEKLG